MGARFTKPVYPGDTIRTEYWNTAGNVQFRCVSVERNEVVLDRGIAKIID
jgi:acyl dehydratase